MKHRNNFFARVLRGMLKLLFGLAIAVFLFSLLLAILVVMLGVTLGSLLTGRRAVPPGERTAMQRGMWLTCKRTKCRIRQKHQPANTNRYQISSCLRNQYTGYRAF